MWLWAMKKPSQSRRCSSGMWDPKYSVISFSVFNVTTKLFFCICIMSFQLVLRPVEVLNSATGQRANDPIISYFRILVKSFFAWSLLLAACCLRLEAFFLIQYLASMRSVFCAANSLNVNVVHFIIIPFWLAKRWLHRLGLAWPQIQHILRPLAFCGSIPRMQRYWIRAQGRRCA